MLSTLRLCTSLIYNNKASSQFNLFWFTYHFYITTFIVLAKFCFDNLNMVTFLLLAFAQFWIELELVTDIEYFLYGLFRVIVEKNCVLRSYFFCLFLHVYFFHSFYLIRDPIWIQQNLSFTLKMRWNGFKDKLWIMYAHFFQSYHATYIYFAIFYLHLNHVTGHMLSTVCRRRI